MKRVLLMVFSIILILACIFGLFACVAGVRDVLNIQEYKTADAAFARENLETAQAGIDQLRENEETYITGVGTYTDGLAQYAKGQSDYAAGKQTLAAGEKTLAEGYAAYNEGKAKLEAGKAEYEAGKKALAEGQAQIDANTQAYNEGKEKLAKIEPLLPYLNQYVQFRDGTIAKLPGFDTAQAWFVSVVRPLASRLGLEIPEDATDFPAYINQMVADGKAQLKQYEDGLATLEAGKAKLAEAEKTIADGEAQLAAAEKELAAGEVKLANGRQDLADGAAKLAAAETQLADGKAQLSVFEQGEIALADGARALFEGMKPCFSYYGGEETVKSLPEYLADEFGLETPSNLIVKENGKAALNEEVYEEFGEYVISNMYKVDENGNVVEKNGYKMLDLDKCDTLVDLAEQYLVDQEADIKSEVYVRIGMYVALAVAAILGIIAGIFGIVAAVNGSKRTGKTLALISAIMAVAVLVTGLVTKFHDYVYTIRVDASGDYVGETASKLDFTPIQEYTGSLHMTAICALAGAAILGVIFAFIASKAAKDKEAALAFAAAEENDDIYGGDTASAYAAGYAAAEAAAAAAAAAAAQKAAEEKVIEAEPAAAPDEETVKE